MELSDPNPVLIADAGTCTVKAGNTLPSSASSMREDAPKVLFSNLVGYPKFKAPIAGLRAKEFYVGDEAVRKRGSLRLEVGTRNHMAEMSG